MFAFQSMTADWLEQCFPPEASKDIVERCDRALEELIELTQACGHDAARAHALVDYVYSRPVGEPGQELGGTMVTLAALANALGLQIQAEAWRELDRVRVPETMAKIRAKQAAKPVGSALPIAVVLAQEIAENRENYARCAKWTALCNEDGEPYAVFVFGYASIHMLSLNAAEEIPMAFSDHCLDDEQSAVLANAALSLEHFWLHTSTPRGTPASEVFFAICEATTPGAFPVTGVRF